jgi:hypothetical protein
VRKNHLSMRVSAEVLDGIEREARRLGRPMTSLAADLLGEALVMRMYPGIGYREGAAGRRAALIGHRIDVHQAVASVQAHGGDVDAAAAHLAVARGLVRSAMEFYADHRDEVDGWARRQAEVAEEAERRWRAGQASASA